MSFHHSFDIEIATKYGVPVAIFLNNLAYWIKKNQANRKHFHDGRYWTYNSVQAYSELFPYWTPKQMRNVLEKLADSGLILKGNYNSTSYDRTLWYSLSDEGHLLLGIPICPLGHDTICPDGQINLGRRANEFAQNGQPIPDALKAPETDKEKSSCRTATKKAKSEKPSESSKEPKTKAEWKKANEKKPDWHDKMGTPITDDHVMCGACRRPSHHCGCSELNRFPKNIGELFKKAGLTNWGKRYGVI